MANRGKGEQAAVDQGAGETSRTERCEVIFLEAFHDGAPFILSTINHEFGAVTPVTAARANGNNPSWVMLLP
jgi:hypothetical protein